MGVLYVLLSVCLEVIKGETLIFRIRKPVTIFGEISLLLDGPHPATVEAVEPCVCRVIRVGREFLAKNPLITLEVAEIVGRQTHGNAGLHMALVYQIGSGCKRVFGVIRDRDTQSLVSFFESFGAERCVKIKVVYSDIWKPYLNASSALCCLPPSTCWTASTSPRSSVRPLMR